MGDETNSLALAISPFRSTRLGATSGTKSAQLIYAISQPSGGFLAVGSRPCLYLHNGLFRYLGASAISAQALGKTEAGWRLSADHGQWRAKVVAPKLAPLPRSSRSSTPCSVSIVELYLQSI